MIQLLKGHDRNIERNSILWNMVASLLYSFQSAVLLLAVTRLAGLEMAGMFSIAYAVSQMFSSIGSFAMREYQASDTNRKYSFDKYMTFRVCSILIMLIMCIGYSAICGYSGQKLVAILLFLGYRVTDVAEDVLHGELQRSGRLDIGARIMSARIAVSSVGFLLALYISKNLVVAAAAMLAIAMACLLVLNGAVLADMHYSFRWDTKGVLHMFLEVLPVCVGAFIYNYLNNSPKYAIDSVLTDDVQAIFNIVYMPVFVTTMLAQFIFKPYVAELGEKWNADGHTGFYGLSIKLVGAIIAAGMVVLLGGFLLGVPVLDFVFGVDLREYKPLFMLLLLFGIVVALDQFGTMLLTVMRRQQFVLVAYAISLVLDLMFMNSIVEKFNLWGAGLVYGLVVSSILVIYIIVILARGGQHEKRGADSYTGIQ